MLESSRGAAMYCTAVTTKSDTYVTQCLVGGKERAFDRGEARCLALLGSEIYLRGKTARNTLSHNDKMWN